MLVRTADWGSITLIVYVRSVRLGFLLCNVYCSENVRGMGKLKRY